MRIKNSVFQSLCIVILLQLTILSCSVGAVTLHQAKPSTEELLSKAREEFANKEYDDARLTLKQLLRMNQESAEANYLLALVYMQSYLYDLTMKYLNQAVAIQPIFPEAHFLMAKLSYEQHDLKKAGEEIETALQQGRNSAEAYKLKGDVEFSNQQYEAALQAYETVLQFPADKLTEVDVKEVERRRKYVREMIESQKHFAEVSAGNEDVDQKPVPINNPRPNYTEAARQKKINGSIRVAARIDEEGKVTDAVLLSSLGYGLDEAAIDAVRNMKFKPAMKNNQAVPYWMRMRIDIGFVLR
jgi:TonB family protein